MDRTKCPNFPARTPCVYRFLRQLANGAEHCNLRGYGCWEAHQDRGSRRIIRVCPKLDEPASTDSISSRIHIRNSDLFHS